MSALLTAFKHVCLGILWDLPKRCIGLNGELYLLRFYLFGRAPNPKSAKEFTDFKPRLTWLPITFYLHRFYRADDERALHNHPWSWSLSLILSGGYEEERRGKPNRLVRAGRFNWISHKSFHRLERLLGTTWSLFIAGPKVSSWGFLRGDGSVRPFDQDS